MHSSLPIVHRTQKADPRWLFWTIQSFFRVLVVSLLYSTLLHGRMGRSRLEEGHFIQLCLASYWNTREGGEWRECVCVWVGGGSQCVCVCVWVVVYESQRWRDGEIRDHLIASPRRGRVFRSLARRSVDQTDRSVLYQNLTRAERSNDDNVDVIKYNMKGFNRGRCDPSVCFRHASLLQ